MIVELFGRMAEDHYMAFGISGAHGRPQMVNGDVVVAFYDKMSRVFRAEDYYLSSLSQCDGKQGVCPDVRIGGRNDIEFLTGDRKNGVTNIKFRRPLQTNEPINDRAIPTDKEVSIIAAIGPLNARQEANSHPHDGLHVNSEDIQINFSSKVCSNTNDLMMSEHHSENEYFKFFYRMTIHVQCLCIRFVMRTRQSHGHRW